MSPDLSLRLTDAKPLDDLICAQRNRLVQIARRGAVGYWWAADVRVVGVCRGPGAGDALGAVVLSLTSLVVILSRSV